MLFSRVRLHSYSRVEESVILPDVQVGRHVRLNRTVIDTGCVIPPGMEIGFDAEADARRFFRTEQGVVLVTRDMLAALADPAAVFSEGRGLLDQARQTAQASRQAILDASRTRQQINAARASRRGAPDGTPSADELLRPIAGPLFEELQAIPAAAAGRAAVRPADP